MKKNLMQNLVSRTTPSLLLYFLLIGLVSETHAQVGLGDIGAANSIRSEMEAGTTGRKRENPEEEAPAEEPIADESNEVVDRGGANGVSFDDWNDEHSILRNPSPSVSWWKMLLVSMVFFAWVKTADWIGRDARIYKLGHEHWGIVAVFPFFFAFLVSLLVPIYFAGLGLMIAAWIVPLIVYAGKHNASVESHQKVFNGDWFRFQLAIVGKSIGLKVQTEKKADYMKGPPVDLQAMGANEETKNQANLMTARRSPAYVLVKELVADMEARHSERVMLDFTQEAVGIRHQIDGVWHSADPRDRESGDVMLAVMKQLANLNVNDRRSKQ